MKRGIIKRLTCLLILTVMLLSLGMPIGAAEEPDTGLPVMRGEWQARLPELFRSTSRPVSSKTYHQLNVGGNPFGVRLFADGVLIVGLAPGDTPASRAGIREKDKILAVNGVEVHCTQDVLGAIEGCGGNPLTLRLRRGEETVVTTVTPTLDENNRYRAGIRVRDHAAGIGTVTFVDPETGAFGGLGHGICDTDTGELIPLTRGAVMKTEINGVTRGTEGTPGELRGYLRSEKIGTLLRNCDRGVFGIFSPIPEGVGGVMEIGTRDQVHPGEAFLRCTLDDGAAREYRIELSDIHPDNTATKCFAVHVTDPELIEKTGGIVQGMSGSPIIQDGRLIGAVTHVLIGDPTRGFGIFLENMLSEMPDSLS